ncbi:pyridoxamine 5'-phosphate oxidase family protein [Clostridium paraputrificum]|uniref:pyridoxamine 5'-phosphate oxidase family protein n=1 Tax=Clostridium TaxID=1485 RepID=UPI003D331CAE
MNKEEILKLISENPAFYLATVEGDQPRVRGMLLYDINEDGILFHTGSMKDLYKQVLGNPKAELCFNGNGTQVRVTGILEIVDDNKLKDEIAENPTRGFVKVWKESGALEDFYNTFIVLRLVNSIATTWTMETNFGPKEFIEI